jgi:hypothetical protein
MGTLATCRTGRGGWGVGPWQLDALPSAPLLPLQQLPGFLSKRRPARDSRGCGSTGRGAARGGRGRRLPPAAQRQGAAAPRPPPGPAPHQAVLGDVPDGHTAAHASLADGGAEVERRAVGGQPVPQRGVGVRAARRRRGAAARGGQQGTGEELEGHLGALEARCGRAGAGQGPKDRAAGANHPGAAMLWGRSGRNELPGPGNDKKGSRARGALWVAPPGRRARPEPAPGAAHPPPPLSADWPTPAAAMARRRRAPCPVNPAVALPRRVVIYYWKVCG